MSVLLVFPSSMSDAIPFIEQARIFGARIVGASSLTDDPNASRCDFWLHLPRVDEADFAESLCGVVTTHGIDGIFCPNNVVHGVIASLIREGIVAARLLALPFHQEIERYSHLEQRAEVALSLAQAISAEAREVAPQNVAAWLHYVDAIMGQSGEVKLAALIGAMASAPRGDVIEIGTYFGKSAAWLTLVAREFDIGTMVAIDPWLSAEAVQYDAPLHVQQLSDGDYWETVAQACVINLLPVADGRFNFLRMPATQALPHYESGSVRSSAFGVTALSGRIALLHIDGNHDYRAVAADVAQWAPKIAPGGWLVLDDYCWPHGDGPRRIGDALITENLDLVSQAFVVDGALFIKLTSWAGVACQ
ncbi:MAG: class I SAM-dependent methyltransferase [bacterium]|jgi:hypothetical protein